MSFEVFPALVARLAGTVASVVVDGEVYGPYEVGQPSEVSFLGRVLTFPVETSTGGSTGAAEIEVYSG